jgi:hypothetical protein
MKLRREIEIDVDSSEVDEIMMSASPFDKLSLMIRMAKTITPDDIKEIESLLGKENVQKSASSLNALGVLHKYIFPEQLKYANQRNRYPILQGHVSFETAYVNYDYPFDKKSKCTARFWLERVVKNWEGGKLIGNVRMAMQFTGPDRMTSSPIYTSYYQFAVMYLTEDNNVICDGLLNPYPQHLAKFKAKYYHQLTDAQKAEVDAIEEESRKRLPDEWRKWNIKYPSVVTILQDFECMTADAEKRQQDEDDPYEDKLYIKGQSFRCDVVEDDGKRVSLDLDYGDGVCGANKEWVNVK